MKKIIFRMIRGRLRPITVGAVELGGAVKSAIRKGSGRSVPKPGVKKYPWEVGRNVSGPHNNYKGQGRFGTPKASLDRGATLYVPKRAGKRRLPGDTRGRNVSGPHNNYKGQGVVRTSFDRGATLFKPKRKK